MADLFKQKKQSSILKGYSKKMKATIIYRQRKSRSLNKLKKRKTRRTLQQIWFIQEMRHFWNVGAEAYFKELDEKWRK